MPRWKPDETEFTVKVDTRQVDRRKPYRRSRTQIPSPIMELLGNPSKIKFRVRGKTVIVERAE